MLKVSYKTGGGDPPCAPPKPLNPDEGTDDLSYVYPASTPWNRDINDWLIDLLIDFSGWHQNFKDFLWICHQFAYWSQKSHKNCLGKKCSGGENGFQNKMYAPEQGT